MREREGERDGEGQQQRWPLEFQGSEGKAKP